MKTTDGSFPLVDLAEKIVQEHGALRQKVQAIDSVLSSHNPNTQEIETLLREFLAALKIHFANEDEEGFFTEVAARAPQHRERAGTLCIEHRELLRQADELCRFAEAGSPSMPWWRELTGRCHEFSKRLANQEREEHRLLDEAHHAGMGPAA